MKGMWMGGVPPLGYRVKDRKLLINEAEAANVRWIFCRFMRSAWHGDAEGAQGPGITTRKGAAHHQGLPLPAPEQPGPISARPSTRAESLTRRARGDHPTEHLGQGPRDPAGGPRKRAGAHPGRHPSLLKGLLYGPDGAAFSPTHTRKGCAGSTATTSARPCCATAAPARWWPPAAGEIEAAGDRPATRSCSAVRRIVAGTWKAARQHDPEITEADARDALAASIRSGTSSSRRAGTDCPAAGRAGRHRHRGAECSACVSTGSRRWHLR
jgi:hypothetical protein